MAAGQPTCKRQVSGSNPLTGSQVSAEFQPRQEFGVERSDPRCALMGMPSWVRTGPVT